MTFGDWSVAIKPKVNGTWNLHHALKDVGFYALFSSVSGLLGQFGQSNYAAANTFLEAFVQYRHSQGLAASVIDLGVMEDVGYVSESPNLLEYFKFLSAHLLTETDLIDVVRLPIARSALRVDPDVRSNPSQLAVGLTSSESLTDPNNHIVWNRDCQFSVYRSILTTLGLSEAANEGLKAFLSKSTSKALADSQDEAIKYLAQEIAKTLYGFMIMNTADINVDQPLASLGLDSLVSIELKNWCKRHLGVAINILETMQSTSRDLAKKVLESLIANR